MSLRPRTVAGGVLGALLLWSFLPLQRPIAGSVSTGGPYRPDVITVFVEDPQRTLAAFRLWRQRPGSLLLLQGQPSSQAVNRSFLEGQNRWPAADQGIVRLTPGCDTVGQITTLSRWLAALPRPGRLTVVTSPAHLRRALEISRIVIGAEGWRIEGLPVRTGDNRPEAPWRLYRDQLRAHLYRSLGWTGMRRLNCEVPAVSAVPQFPVILSLAVHPGAASLPPPALHTPSRTGRVLSHAPGPAQGRPSRAGCAAAPAPGAQASPPLTLHPSCGEAGLGTG